MWKGTMDIKEYVETLSPGGMAAIIAVAATLVQIAPIKINPWSALVKCVRHILLGDLMEKVEKLDAKIDKHEAILCRQRILLFDDELLHHVDHTKEHFDQIKGDIVTYNNYCDSHPEFKNGVTGPAVEHINRVYDKLMDSGGFLSYPQTPAKDEEE